MKINKKFLEISGVIAVMLGVIILQWDLWVTGRRMFTGDSIRWFGVFSYFSDCLQQGVLPLWNPYMNCGEVFFLNIHVLHLWDPCTLFLVFTGKFFRIDALTIYQYDLLFRYLIFILGGYFFFRRMVKYKFSAFVGFMVLSFSALCSSYLKQHAFVFSFYLLPWVLLFTFKFLEKRDSVWLVWLALFWGIALSSYHSMYLISSIMVLVVCIFLSGGFGLSVKKGFLKDRKYLGAAVLIGSFLTVILLPVFLAYTRNTVPTARIFEATMAAHSFFADFLNLFAPYSFILHYFDTFYMSESFLYIGLIPLFLAIIGLFYSRHKYKTGFALAAMIIALLMLGPKFLISLLFSSFFPFFEIIRNTHTFGPFFVFCLAYFTCLGTDVVFDLSERGELSRYKNKFLFIVFFIVGAAFLITRNVISIYKPLVAKSSVIFEVVSSVTVRDLNFMIDRGFLSGSYSNALLFIVSVVAVYYVLRRPKSSLMFKYLTVIIVILLDLVIFNLSVFNFVTMDKVDVSLRVKEISQYYNYRIPMVRPQDPFLGFAPAMQRKFSAVSSRIPWVTTHFYEMKDYFNFVNNGQIPVLVKSAFMGISAPKLRLANNVVVLPADHQPQEYKKLDEKTVNCVIFIEEELPVKFQKLKITTQMITQADIAQGTIKVLKFDPNSLFLEVDAKQDSLLYYSDGFDKSWRAFIDGKESKIYRTNLAFKSVIVEKGKHLVRFVYDPRLYKAALFCFFCGLFVAAVMLIYILFKQKGSVWKK